MKMKRLNVFATEEEAAEIRRLFIKAMFPDFNTAHCIKRDDREYPPLHRTLHGYAMAHGLPEIQGYYGIDLENREFIEYDQ